MCDNLILNNKHSCNAKTDLKYNYFCIGMIRFLRQHIKCQIFYIKLIKSFFDTSRYFVLSNRSIDMIRLIFCH